ncbi:MAG TPA: hypothetical protein VHR66_18170 [Gemmataceae bacterium]|jgi:hypothetical protein|nr:hypothetical protein [Gemmataceae bacterium]
MAARTISITYPGMNATLGTTFYVQGTCSLNHTIKVSVNKASDGTTVATKETTVTSGTNVWSAGFTLDAGTYNIEATCGQPPVTTQVDNITLQ